jgi:hypothetical protein
MSRVKTEKQAKENDTLNTLMVGGHVAGKNVLVELGDFGALLSCDLIFLCFGFLWEIYIEVSWRLFPVRWLSLFLSFRSGPTL